MYGLCTPALSFVTPSTNALAKYGVFNIDVTLVFASSRLVYIEVFGFSDVFGVCTVISVGVACIGPSVKK